MGCFNTLIVKCPNCGDELEFQTKSGTCTGEAFDKYAPITEIVGAVGKTEKCECGATVEIVDVERQFRIQTLFSFD